MKAKDKAKELVDRYMEKIYTPNEYRKEIAIECALICCNVTIEELEYHSWQNRHIIVEFEEIRKEIENYG